jgi:hypothetical protein
MFRLFSRNRHHRLSISVPDWSKRLHFSHCGSRNVDFVLTGARP